MSTLTLVFLSPGALGHANVHIALCRYFLTNLVPGVVQTNIHVVADETSRPQFRAVIKSSEHCTVYFDAMADDNFLDGVSLKSPPPQASKSQSWRIYNLLTDLWFRSPTAHLKRYSAMVKILESVNPDLVVVDMLYSPLGVDACRKTGHEYVMLSPGSTLDISGVFQPLGRGFWYYPALLSNILFPVPWHLIPWNAACVALQLFAYTQGPARRKLDAARKAAGISGAIFPPVSDGAKALLHASLPDLEYPHTPLKGSVYCGPIVTRVPKIDANMDRNIAEFLDRNQTFHINMGSVFKYSVEDVTAIAKAIASAYRQVSKTGGFQVLWKLPGSSNYRETLDKHLDGIDRDHILIQDWIIPPSLAVLQHPNIVASINHGGANSVVECAFAGVPQILLPVWLDLYSVAVRVETLGHGIYANRGYEPSLNANMLADAMLQILDCRPGTKGFRIKQKAEELAKVVQEVQGDKRAAEAIVKVAMGRLGEVPYA